MFCTFALNLTLSHSNCHKKRLLAVYRQDYLTISKNLRKSCQIGQSSFESLGRTLCVKRWKFNVVQHVIKHEQPNTCQIYLRILFIFNFIPEKTCFHNPHNPLTQQIYFRGHECVWLKWTRYFIQIDIDQKIDLFLIYLAQFVSAEKRLLSIQI